MEDTPKEKDTQKAAVVSGTGDTPKSTPAQFAEATPASASTSSVAKEEDTKKKDTETPQETVSSTPAATAVASVPPVSTAVTTSHTVKASAGMVMPVIVRENKILATLIAISLVVLAIGLLYKHTDLFAGGENRGDVSAVIDAEDTVALVNGEEITGAAFNQQLRQTALGIGIEDISASSPEVRAQLQNQVIDTLVNTELILQAAHTAGIEASDEEVQTMYSTIIAQAGGEEVAMERLNQLGITVIDIKENIRDDLVIQQYINEQVGANSLEVTDEEIQAFYDQVSAGQEGLPSLDEVSFQIEEQLRFTKEQEVVTELLEMLRDEADIEVYI